MNIIGVLSFQFSNNRSERFCHIGKGVRLGYKFKGSKGNGIFNMISTI